jgi:hypothetical protein
MKAPLWVATGLLLAVFAVVPAHAKKSGGGLARERACAAEWKADKAAGKIPAGMKWPQYWSACNKRKKAEEKAKNK